MKKSAFVACIVWLLLSCYGLFWRVPSPDLPSFAHTDKVAHFLMFFGQFYLLAWLVGVNTPKKWAGVWLIALAWAVASELIQGFFTTRHMDFWDSVADMTGATLALTLALWVVRPSRR